MSSTSPTSSINKASLSTYDEARSAQIYLFGDLARNNFEQHLEELFHCQQNPLLLSFFEKVGQQLRLLLPTLSLQHQNLFPHFTTLIDLFARRKTTKGASVLRFFFLSLHEVALTITHFSENAFPTDESCYVVGLCTGGFAAAALSCSANATHLVQNGTLAVLAAFVTALESWSIGETLVVQTDNEHESKSWSAVASAHQGFDALQVFNEHAQKKKNGLSTKLWISAVASSKAITVSGCPKALEAFQKATVQSLRCQPLDIESPFHASHLFDVSIGGKVLATFTDKPNLKSNSQQSYFTFCQPSTGRLVKDTDLVSLLELVVTETLRETINWDITLNSVVEDLRQDQVSNCFITSFCCNAFTSIRSRIRDELHIPVHGQVPIMPPPLTPSGDAGTRTGKFDQSKIAIIGYSGRFPSAASNQAFWDLLMDGRDVHRPIPRDRFDAEAHYDPTGRTKNTSRVKHGCFIDEPGLFDARFFNMSPREAENTDPAQRLAITTTYEAMEMAGFVRNRTPSTQQDRIGVFFGTTSDDWREVNSGQDVGTYFIPGGNRAFVPGRISYFFGLSGPSISVDTACSSSFAAIQSACGYLWRGECDTAIAGGTNILTNPDNFAGLDKGHFLSTTGNCNAFDDGANGYCRSDAVGSVILKRLADAKADHDPIFGVILGTNTNHCGQTDSITRPHEGDQSSVFNRIIRHANIDPLSVSYVEMHGTGTQAGDATEMRSVSSVFASDHRRTESEPQRPLYIGSAKANIGHAESASGVTSLIKVLMMMKHNTIPPHVGIKTEMNHNYPKDLAERGINIALAATSWPRGPTPRRTFLNNFSAAGGNTAVLLQDAPIPVVSRDTDTRSSHVIPISAKSSTSLIANIQSIISWLEKSRTDNILPSLSYTLTARRMHHRFRVMATGADRTSVLDNLKSILKVFDKVPEDVRPIPSGARGTPRVVFTFSGQGSFYASLARTLFMTTRSFRERILQLDEICTAAGFPPFVGVINGLFTTEDIRGITPVVSHLALVCLQIALADLWMSWGIYPAAVIGHSLGEYPALYTAGVLSAVDVITLVGGRARLLETYCTPGTHTMLALAANGDQVLNLLQQVKGGTQCEVACSNQPEGQVIAGPKQTIDKIIEEAAAQKIKSTKLDIPYAFHSSQVEPILEDFEKLAAESATFHAPSIPFMSPLKSKVIPAGNTDTLGPKYVRDASRGKVDFVGALRTADSTRHNFLEGSQNIIWLEIGPHTTCTGMIKRTLDDTIHRSSPSLRQGVDSYMTLTSAVQTLFLAGCTVDWMAYHKDFPACQQVLELPAYSWESKNYWIDYRNDFCLTKGDVSQQRTAVVEAEPPPTKYISPCAQKILEEQHGKDASDILVESDLFDAKLLPILQGHLVNDTALAPSSMYADVAITLGKYLISKRPEQAKSSEPGLEIVDVKINKPLIAAHTETSHKFQVKAHADWVNHIIRLDLFSVSSEGKRTTSHVTLNVIVVANQHWLSTWNRSSHFVVSRVEALTLNATNPTMDHVDVIKRNMAYKLFSSLVTYSPEYRGMADVIMDSDQFEAVSTVKFAVSDSSFCVDPRWIDSLGQVAGFIMNANDSLDYSDQVFINHGWESIRIAEEFQANKTYKAYNRMQHVEKTTYQGDTYVLDGNRIIAIYEGVVFKGIPRRLLNQNLPGKTAPLAPAVRAPRPSANPQIPASAKILAAKKASLIESNNTSRITTTVLDKILDVICKEVGILQNDLRPELYFAELGVDSILSLTLAVRVREQVNIELPQTFFVDNPTVGDAFRYFDGDDTSPDTPMSGQTTLTPGSEVSPAATPHENEGPGHEQTASKTAQAVILLRRLVIEETGVTEDMLVPDTRLGDLGVDSLLGLNISSRLQEELNIKVDSSIFFEYETFGEIEKAIGKTVEPFVENTNTTMPSKPSGRKSAKSHSEDFVQKVQTELSHLEDKQTAKDRQQLPTATSVLLSGPSRGAQEIVFMFPDGSGSASSYVAFAQVAAAVGRAVYGLNCPWRKTAEKMTEAGIDFTTMVERYIPEIQKLFSQQQMPDARIILGGWSAGGIVAFEAAKQLAEGTQPLSVSNLLLLDSPNPIGLQNPPQRMYDFFDKLGIFGGQGQGGKAPSWLRAHFDAFIRTLDAYEPKAWSDSPPRSLIVYARDGVCKDPAGPQMETFPNDPREMLWLLNNRTDFSAKGWKSVLGEGNLDVGIVDNVNHFSLMDQGQGTQGMARLVERFLRLS